MKTCFRPILLLEAALFLASIVPIPARAQDRLKLSTVVIDPGHGGHDSGCISRDKKTYEKSLTLDISQRFARKIREAFPDVKVILTRNEDKYVTLSGRADIANNAGADLFVSIHINAQDKGTSANGYSIHCLGQSSQKGNDLFGKNLELCKRENSVILLEDDYQTKYQGFDPSDPQSYIFFSLMQNAHLEQSLVFASDIADAMKGGPITRTRGVSQDPFWVLWRTTMPSVLVEVGFISNDKDLAAMRSSDGRDQIAGNLLKAFTTFKNRYDHSTGSTSSAKPAPVTEAKPGDAPAATDTQKGSTVYGIQVLATSRRMSSGDSFFKGYETLELKVGNLYKYLLLPEDSLEKARERFKEISPKYPGCFIVKKEGETLTRIH